eukprot:CAMPEP_0195059366 /NCGR_PEP_ID=MMETSP0448-20130528/6868_1 /TAXON_ID=66468 /ORGANISM="Heterocapsa triquestra, Strain CCMP 448" /LENGTH=86 /DNA_ID=CAMNT_0040089627 /DNA_START=733 /DNA_END=989 /DNA_ORIENTATION=-
MSRTFGRRVPTRIGLWEKYVTCAPPLLTDPEDDAVEPGEMSMKAPVGRRRAPGDAGTWSLSSNSCRRQTVTATVGDRMAPGSASSG